MHQNLPPRPADLAERAARSAWEILADLPDSKAPIRTSSPAWRDDSATTPDLPPERSECPACRGYGPSARVDGWRWDSSGVDAPCPDCGAKAIDHHLRVVGGGR